jgi:hypothetical protein
LVREQPTEAHVENLTRPSTIRSQSLTFEGIKVSKRSTQFEIEGRAKTN